MTVAALYVQRGGAYWDVPGVDPWDEERDARRYAGPWPVVAHPPCQRWVNYAAVNWKRYGRQRPAWYPGGDDGGLFAYALDCVRRFGGVLEHPASSHAWSHHRLLRPVPEQWSESLLRRGEWVCQVSQSAYGHQARKRTWLCYVGPEPPPLDWSEPPGTHQIGWFDRAKPTLSKRAASATPLPFRDLLLDLARRSQRGG